MWLAGWRSRLEDRRYERGDQKHARFLLKRRQAWERAKLGYYQDGYTARKRGKPIEPPGYPPIKDYDPDDEGYYQMRAGAWIAGWEAANNENG